MIYIINEYNNILINIDINNCVNILLYNNNMLIYIYI